MGEPTTLCASFRRSVRIEVRDDGLSSFGGVAYLREFEERSGFLHDLLSRLKDPRAAARVAHDAAELLRLAIYGRALGFPDIADADLLRFDPVLRSVLAPGMRDRVGNPLAAKSTLHRFVTDVLVLRENRHALVEALLDTGLRPLLSRGRVPRRLYVDLDSTMSEVHGEQEGSCNNGYFRAYCYHPLVLSIARLGTILGFLLRRGNASTAQHATLFVLPLLRRLREKLPAHTEIVLRADSGFADPVLFEALEREGFFYLVRLRENARLLRKAARIERRSGGRPSLSKSAYHYLSFRYRAKSWSKDRRVVARAEFKPGTLFPDWTLLCVHLPRREKRRRVLRAYLRRGESEQVHDVFKNELRGDRMSQHRMRSNQIRGLLAALAQNLLIAFDHATRHPRRRRRPATIRAKVLLVATTIVRHARSLFLRVSAAGKHARSLLRIARAVAAYRPVATRSTA